MLGSWTLSQAEFDGGLAVTWLERCSPKALGRIRGATEAFQRRGHDYAAQTVFGCRRAFEALADAPCPACERR